MTQKKVIKKAFRFSRFSFRTAADRPFSNSELGTLREKHNTVMLMLQVMEEQAKSSRQGEGGDKVCDKVMNKDDILHLDRRETPLDNETFKLIEPKKNVVTDKLFIGSFYIGGSMRESPGTSSPSNPRHGTEDKGSWRVKI